MNKECDYTMKKTGIILALLLLLSLCVGCGGKKTMKLANVNEAKNTFDLVDSGTGQRIEYDRLIIDGKEVVDWLCTSMAGSDAVVFATEEGQIVRDGNRTTFSGHGYTTEASMEYKLEDGTLTVTGIK